MNLTEKDLNAINNLMVKNIKILKEELRLEMKENVEELRTEMKDNVVELRTELYVEIEDLKKFVRKEIADANTEQMELMFRHFPTKDEVPIEDQIRKIIREETAEIRYKVAKNEYRLDLAKISMEVK